MGECVIKCPNCSEVMEFGSLHLWVSISYGESNVMSEYKGKGIIRHGLYWVQIETLKY